MSNHNIVFFGAIISGLMMGWGTCLMYMASKCAL